MNERIRELINEATSFKEGLIEEKYDIEVFDKEKFAELIVQECAEIAETAEPYKAEDLIRKHFGMNPKEITTAMLDAAIDQCNRELAKTKSGVEQ